MEHTDLGGQIRPGARDQSDGVMESVGALNLGRGRRSISMAGMGVCENTLGKARERMGDTVKPFHNKHRYQTRVDPMQAM